MTDTRLEKDMMDDVTMCNMLMRIGASRIDVVVYSIVTDNTLVYRSFPVEAHEPLLRRLEETVYDNPLLLSEFRKVFILVESVPAMLYPSAIESADSVRAMFRALFPLAEGQPLTAPTSTRNASMAYAVPADLMGFIKRTFTGATVIPHLLPLIRYISTKTGRGNAGRMICNLRDTSIDVVALDGNRLLQATTFPFTSASDAVYFILASRSDYAVDPEGDELLLAGDKALRDEIIPMLRAYVSRVMPVIFPPRMFRAGREAMSAPFDLIITPLCE